MSKILSKLVAIAIATCLCWGLGIIGGSIQPAQAAITIPCEGLDAGGNPYTANYADGLFTQIQFSRSDLPPVTTELTYDTVNEQGQPIYRGSYLEGADVTLIDLSKGNVKPGSEVSIAVDNAWNQERGVCKAPPATLPCEGLDQNGNPYTAESVGGSFTQVQFTRSNLPPVTTTLTYDTKNEQGEPIYRGSYLGAADVTLIDLSKGEVKPGSKISVAVDNTWNQKQGVCTAPPVTLACPGVDNGGRPYTATAVGDSFTQVSFTRPDLPPVTSELSYDTDNEKGEPIYRGSYLGAADVTLIDISKKHVKPGSQVSVAVDNAWNQERGVCERR